MNDNNIAAANKPVIPAVLLAPAPNHAAPVFPKVLSVIRKGETFTGSVKRISAEIVLPNGQSAFKTLEVTDFIGSSTPTPMTVSVTTPRAWSINQKFDFMTDLINMVIEKVTCSLIITGSGGLGKTSSVVRALREANLVEGEEDGYIMLKGYSTPRGFYEFLYRNNGKLIVVDDCDSVFDTETGVNILKGALDSFDTRTVCWQSRETARDSEEDAVPNRFEFTGRVIFISNRTQDDVPQALRSRSMNIDLTMTLVERVDRIQFLMPAIAEREGVTANQAADVMDLLIENKNAIRDLNIRTAVMAIRIRKTAHVDSWRDLALFQLTHN